MSDQRRELAAQQAELLDALLAGGTPPPGFDAERLRTQAQSLIGKRRSVVARQRPELVEELGGRFSALCEQYCREHPPRASADGRTDADAFHHWLLERGAIAPPRRRRRLRGWLLDLP